MDCRIPRKCHVTELLIRHFRESVQHRGRDRTHNETKSSSYWIIGGSSAVS